MPEMFVWSTTVARPKIAIVYDFDGTLSPGSMQDHSFIKELGVSAEAFWAEVNAEAADLGADNILIYMEKMIQAARQSEKSINKDRLRDHGKKISFFPGVDEFFERIRDFGKVENTAVEHFIISSGLLEMIKGCKIGTKKNFSNIFACQFKFDADKIPVWPAISINYTNKTQFLFRINKGKFDLSDHKELNEYMPQHLRPYPFHRMIYIGDGDTDVPCMRTVKEQGGFSIAVYDPNIRGRKSNALKLKEQGRVNAVLRADYSVGSELDNYVKNVIRKMALDTRLNTQ